MKFLLPCIYSFFGSFGYCIISNVRPRKHMLLLASVGGALCWGAYLLLGFLKNDILQAFLATVILAFYAELMARLFKSPATVYLIMGIIPLVPGAGIYYTMEACINGDLMEFMRLGVHTFGIAGALALGILVVTAVMQLPIAARALKGKRAA